MEKVSGKMSFYAKISLLFTAILWGTSLTVVKSASDVFNPNMILGIRFTISGIILAAVFHKRLLKEKKYEISAGLILGIIIYVSYISQTVGVTFTTPGRSGFLTASYCVLVPFIYWLVAKERPDKFNITAAILCVAGIFLIGIAGGGSSAIHSRAEMLLGDGLSLLSGFAFAGHIVAITKFGVRKDPFVLTIFQFISAAVLSWIATFLFEDNSHIVISARPVLELLYLSVMCTAIALLLQTIGQKYTDPNSAAIILGCESIFGLIFPIMLGMESLNIKSSIGFILIFTAIIISETKLSFVFGTKD